MKKSLLSLIIFLTIPFFIESAPRLANRRLSSHRIVREAKESKSIYKADLPPQVSEKDRDYLMFTNFVGIAVNFVKLFMDPTNIPEAKQNVYNILNGINNLAHVITRSSLSRRKQEELALKIIEICSKGITQHDA
jgi:hypothetical protein